MRLSSIAALITSSIAVTILIALIISICAFTPAIGATAEKEVRIADKAGDWGHPSPYLAYSRGPGYLRMHFIFDTLVWKNETAGPIPLLATDWEYSFEEDVYVFNLAENAKWHDGEPVTADDVAFTISYMKEHPYGWTVLDSVDRAEATGPHTVKIYMNRPYAPFMEDVGGTMPILPEHIWHDVANPMDFVDDAAFIGSGPFKYADFSKEHGTYRYVAFDEYHLGRPVIDQLIYVKAGDTQMALQHGEADFADVKPDMADTLQERGFVVIAGPHYWNKKIMINHNKEPLDNVVFRQALCYAINQSEFVDKSHRGHGKPASYGLISSESVWASPNVPEYPYDPDKAKELISTLGYELAAADGNDNDHANGESGLVNSADQGWYRFLSGHMSGDGDGVEGFEDGMWEKGQPDLPQGQAGNHNEYLGFVGDHVNFAGFYNLGHTTTAYCCGCHGNFHIENPTDRFGTLRDWQRHPSDAVIPNESEYAATGGDSNLYDPLSPVARPTVDATPSGTVTPGADMVMCLSCHRPHGSPYDDLLRWDYASMEAGDGSDDKGCFYCHTTKNDA